MRDSRLADEHARDLVRAALDANLFVEAGAGTGKTEALVDRVAALVLAGRPIEKIVAITFTEKAAAELKDRIRAKLEEALPPSLPREGLDEVPPATRPRLADLVERALTSLDRAQISTIHAFGLALLRSHAAAAGIDPGFVVQDEVLAERTFHQRWWEYLESLPENPGAVAVFDRCLALGITPAHCETLARDLGQRPGLAARLAARPLAAPPATWPDLPAAWDRLARLSLDAAPAEDRLRVKVEALLTLVEQVLAAPAEEREARLAAGAGILGDGRYGVGRAEDWDGAIQEVREAARDIRAWLQATLDGLRAAALADLLPLIVRFVRYDATLRGREGALVFDDLILRARDLLDEDAQARQALRRRYDVLLIDEFQDTDPLQVDIALAFAADPASGRLEAGRLFLVGDPKQSIYRFRRADMAIYADTRVRMEQGGAAFVDLGLNRRSRGAIIDWVNRVFARLIGSGEDRGVQPPYRAIHPVRDVELRGPGVTWLGGELERPAREVRRHEAEALASLCHAVRDKGWQVAERDGTVRPACYRDVAILLPVRTGLPALEDALVHAGVPYRVESGSLLYRTQEVRDLVNCLGAIDDPADEVAIVAALRSPAFACSDVDIARFRAGGGHFDYLAADLANREGMVADALRVLRAFHLARHEKPLAALVEEFAADRRLAEIGILDQATRHSFRRARFVVEQARAFEANGPESLRGFVAWLESRAGEASRDHEGARLDDDEDAVRVITIHTAKGLEFPIVFVAGLGTNPRHLTPTYLFEHGLDRGLDRVGVSIGAKTRNAQFTLGPVADLDAQEERHEGAEHLRLLYVAATRARDHLVLSLFHPARASRCGARRLVEAGACQGVAERPGLAAVERAPVAPLADLPLDFPAGTTAAGFAETREALVAAATTQRYTSATALRMAADREDQATDEEERTDETEPWARGRGSSRLGRAVHAAIQSLPLDAGDAAIAAFARAQAVAEAIPERTGDVARLVRRALASGAAGRARAARRALREVPFGVSLDGTILEGFIDLVVETEAGLEIVDWKTDHISPSEVAGRLKEYELQAGLYVVGLEAATGRPVARVTYVFVGPGVEETLGDPRALADTARARLEEVAGAANPS